MSYATSTEQQEAFERDGAILLPGVVGEDWLDRLRAAIERDIADPGPHYHGYQSEPDKGAFHGNMRLWEADADFRDYCLNGPLPELAATMLNSDRVNLLYDQLFVKEPGASNPTRWHNDQPYWPVAGWPVMSFWLALDPVTRDSGAVEFVRGSHKWDRWFQPETFAKGANSGYEKNEKYEPIPDIDGNRDQYDFVIWDMAPGDVIAFHAMAVHGSSGNLRQDRRRRGYTVRYTGVGATYDPRPGTHKGIWNPALEPGAVMDSDQYPVVWPRQSGQVAAA